MRSFEHFSQSGAPCSICGTLDDKPSVLVPIYGSDDGSNCEALQIHLDCINLTVYRNNISILLVMNYDEIKEPIVQSNQG